ncbi:energy transducer TonB [Pseudomonas sp. MAP12]|uniref:Energy transducer TonB n=1 Tax=Geopseudomonas aromaticivorans TaxID=2849492 RepID=A0ABS6MSY5_9GAMM|nr:energy transducer TonB [Pseudomonas aromaticivorans]MBV2131908.1 energy transducer TonB [Pseudomonas aromaticivorans]
MSLARSLPRWASSLLLVLGLHVGVALWSLDWQPQATPLELPPPAMLIELAPAPPAAAPPPPEPVRAPEPPPQPKLIEAPKPRLSLPPPPKPRPHPPKPVAKPQPAPKAEPQPAVEPQANAQPMAPARSEPAAQPSPPAGSPAPAQAQASWQSRLLAHLNRHKRYPEDARRRGQQGVVKLRFVVDGQGQVLSFELAGKSGSASLDRATLQMIRRAQPLPMPPAELLRNGSLEVVAPFVYSLERR